MNFWDILGYFHYHRLIKEKEMKRLSDKELEYTASITKRDDIKVIILDLLASRKAIEVLREGLKDALYVFEGSTADEGQSDEELEAREEAIMRFLECESQADKILRGEDENK